MNGGEDQGTIEALNIKIRDLRNDYERVVEFNAKLHAEIDKLQSTVKSQTNDIQYWSSQSKSWEREISNIQCQKFHLQGSVDALTMVINKLLDPQNNKEA
jgi:chromosome segregation ATPase